MAIHYANNATKRDNSVPSQKIIANENFGRVRVLYDKYDFSNGQLTSGDDLYMMKIPKGAKVLGGAFVAAQGSASAGKCTVGWLASSDAVESVDVDGLFAEKDFGNGDIVAGMLEETAAPAGLFKTFAAEVQAYCEISETSVAADEAIELLLYYAVD
jgi:hypothetical protein